MPTSPRLRWPYPALGAPQWFSTFEALVNASDASAYAYREDRQVIFMEGGTFSFTASTGVLAWSGTIELLAGLTGFRWTVAPSSVVLQDGQLLYFDLVRGPTQNTVLTAIKASQVSSSDAGSVFCVRRGDRIYFKYGYILLDGQPFPVLSEPGGGGSIRDNIVPHPKEVTGTTETYVGSTYFGGTELMVARAMIGSQILTDSSTLRIRRNSDATLLTDIGGVVGALADRAVFGLVVVPGWYDIFLFSSSVTGTTICGGLYLEWA